MTHEGTIHITRVAASWRDRKRAYRVMLDGSEIGRIKDGESQEFAALTGHHTLRLKIDWAGSDTIEFDLQPSEAVAFECEPAGSAMRALSDSLAALRRGGRPWVVLRRVS